MTDLPWMRVAREQIGVAEIPGPKSNNVILRWAAALGKRLGIAYTNDDTPWCGLFVGMCMEAAGWVAPKIAIRAMSWASWGEELEEPIEGCILVFQRQGGGHVGFYAGETRVAYKVLGGNQGNRVSYAWLAKDRCVAMRWPPDYPRTQRLLELADAAPLSTNEA